MEIMTQHLPLISVIIPMYNVEKYIVRCLSSIIEQTYENLEIILVNDGSTDDTKMICQSFVENDDRIKLHSVENAGVSAARNLGITLAKGAYIQFIDSDDYITKDYISTLYELIIDHSVDLAVCSIVLYDTKNQPITSWDAGQNILDFNAIDENYLIEIIKSFLLFGPVNKLYKTKVIRDNKVNFDTSISYGEDLIFNMDYLMSVSKVIVTNKVHYGYFQMNTNSLSNKFYLNKYDISKKIHNRLIAFFSEKSINFNALTSVLYQRFFDDCYNAMSLVVHTKFKKNLFQKIKYIKKIVNDKEFIKSQKYIEPKKYAAKVIFLIKNKMILTYYLYVGLSTKKIFLKTSD